MITSHQSATQLTNTDNVTAAGTYKHNVSKSFIKFKTQQYN